MERTRLRWFPRFGALALLSTLAACGGGGGGGTQPHEPQPPPANVIVTLSAVADSPGSIALSWNSVGDRRYYWVFMDGYLYTQVYQFAQQPVTAAANRLQANREYCFRVVAYTESPYLYVGESGNVCAKTPVDTQPPDAPAYLKSVYSAGADEMRLQWLEGTDDAWVERYGVYRDDAFLGAVDDLGFLDATAASDRLHCYQITAIDPSGNESERSIKSCASRGSSTAVAAVPQTLGTSGGVKTSLALDGAGKAHIGFHDAESGALYYATNAAGEWAVATIDTQARGSPSLALDSLGKVHIAFAGEGIYSLKHATNRTGDWVVSTVDGNWVGLDPSLAIDADDRLHVSYYDYQNGTLKYATDAAGSWALHTLDNGYLVGKGSSVDVEPSGTVHISYYDEGNRRLRYATNASGDWVTETLDGATEAGSDSDLVVDATGKVHIGYYDEQNRALKYAAGNAGAWVVETVDAGGADGTGWNPSLCLDAAGKLHISYNDWGYGYLRYLTGVSGVWESYVIGIPPSGGGATQTDATGKVHLSYQEGVEISYSIYATE